jgi:hypothetical protein
MDWFLHLGYRSGESRPESSLEPLERECSSSIVIACQSLWPHLADPLPLCFSATNWNRSPAAYTLDLCSNWCPVFQLYPWPSILKWTGSKHTTTSNVWRPWQHPSACSLHAQLGSQTLWFPPRLLLGHFSSPPPLRGGCVARTPHYCLPASLCHIYVRTSSTCSIALAIGWSPGTGSRW